MLFLTIINALPVNQRMKNAFLENRIFTEYNLCITVNCNCPAGEAQQQDHGCALLRGAGLGAVLLGGGGLDGGGRAHGLHVRHVRQRGLHHPVPRLHAPHCSHQEITSTDST